MIYTHILECEYRIFFTHNLDGSVSVFLLTDESTSRS